MPMNEGNGPHTCRRGRNGRFVFGGPEDFTKGLDHLRSQGRVGLYSSRDALVIGWHAAFAPQTGAFPVKINHHGSFHEAHFFWSLASIYPRSSTRSVPQSGFDGVLTGFCGGPVIPQQWMIQYPGLHGSLVPSPQGWITNDSGRFQGPEKEARHSRAGMIHHCSAMPLSAFSARWSGCAFLSPSTSILTPMSLGVSRPPS